MNEEIKEILEELKEKNEIYKELIKNRIIKNEYYKSHLLLDYITNLQEENIELKKKIKFNEKSRRKMQQSLMIQLENYKSRNEKAIEYIEDEIEKKWKGN